MNDLISLNEAAELIGKNLRTIQRYIKDGKLSRHDENEKSFVSKKEVEEKFGVLKAEKAEIKKESATEKENHVAPPPVQKPKYRPAEESTWQKEFKEYQQKWIDEVKAHAETKESLGEWKGRAEAYQAFAARLLGDGQPPEIKKSDTIVSPIKNYLLYIVIGVLFIALVVLGILVRFWILG